MGQQLLSLSGLLLDSTKALQLKFSEKGKSKLNSGRRVTGTGWPDTPFKWFMWVSFTL